MTFLDRFIQNWRVRTASRFIIHGMKVLDLGSADGVLLDYSGICGPGSMGIDPTLPAPAKTAGGHQLIPGFFPQDLPPGRPFDAIAMLAVLEHFPNDQHAILADGIAKHLRPGGLLVITVPSAAVDHILKVLTTLRLIHGMSLEEHHGYDTSMTAQSFCPPRFRLLKHEKFQLGLNNLFVFERLAS
jgi:SAM-dependent methyltransferase